MTKRGYLGGVRFFFLAFFAILPYSSILAQNVRIGTVDWGEFYAIPAGMSSLSMTFTEDGAIAATSANAVWGGRVIMNATGTLYVDDILTLDGGIEGSGDLTITGNGTLLLHSVATQTGWTIIDGGTLQVGENKNRIFAAASPVWLLNSGTLDLNNTTQEIASLVGDGTVQFGWDGTGRLTAGGNDFDTSFSGDFTGIGTLVKIGRGTMTLTGLGSSFDPVNFDVTAGTLNVNGYFNVSGSTTTVRNGATFGGSGEFYDVSVQSGGTLAPGIRLGYAGLATNMLTVGNALTLDTGSTLSIRVDAAGNSDQVIVRETYINNSANLEIDALAGKYTATNTYDAFLDVPGGANLDDFHDISLRQNFLKLQNVTEDSFRIGRIAKYFSNRARGENQRAVARVFDQTTAAGLWQPMTNIAASTNRAAINDAYREISGAVNANSLMLGQWRTSTYALKHLDLTRRGMSQDLAFWVEAVHQTTDFDADYNSRPYGISRTGFLLGGEERSGDCVFGMLGGYSQARLYSQDDQFLADDTQFGFYIGTKLCNRVDTKFHIGYGHQEYTSRRFLRSPLIGIDDTERINGRFRGDSMSMSLEFAVPFDWALFQIKPLFAIDSDLTWQYGYDEIGDTGCELGFSRTFFDRTFIRVGLEGQIGSVKRYTPMTLTGRLNYSRLAGGNPYPMVRSVFLADSSTPMRIYGLNPGKDFINLGVGFRWNFDNNRSFYADYDLTTSKRSNAHFASLGYGQKW